MVIGKDVRDIVLKRVMSRVPKATKTEEKAVSDTLDIIFNFIEDTDTIQGFGTAKKLFRDYRLEDILVWSELADLVLPASVKYDQQDETCRELLFANLVQVHPEIDVEDFMNAQRKIIRILGIKDANFVTLASLKKFVNLSDVISHATFAEDKTIGSSPALVPIPLKASLANLYDDDLKNWSTKSFEVKRWLRNHLLA